MIRQTLRLMMRRSLSNRSLSSLHPIWVHTAGVCVLPRRAFKTRHCHQPQGTLRTPSLLVPQARCAPWRVARSVRKGMADVLRALQPAAMSWTPEQELIGAACNNDVPDARQALAHGANIEVTEVRWFGDAYRALRAAPAPHV